MMDNAPDIFNDFSKNITASSITAKRISIRKNKFRVMVNGEEINVNDKPYLDIVIINASAHVHRIYYDSEYTPGVRGLPPVCWSSNSLTPDVTVAHPQSAFCGECAQNVKGSGPKGSTACRFSRRIAVVKENDLNGDVFQMVLPARSIFGNGTAERKPLHQYTDYVKANNQNLMSVVSRVSFDMDSSSIRVGFKPIRVLNDEEYDICKKQNLSMESKRAVELTVGVASNKTTHGFTPVKQESTVADSSDTDLQTLLSAWH